MKINKLETSRFNAKHVTTFFYVCSKANAILPSAGMYREFN